MSGVLKDYVITYDRNFVEENVDSSDFEEDCTPIFDINTGNCNLIGSKKRINASNYSQPQFNMTASYIDCDQYPVKLKREREIPKDSGTFFKKLEKKSLSKYKLVDLNRVESTKSKFAILKHKVIPCISSIFKRAHFAKHNMSVIEENTNENMCIDNCCQCCSDCEQMRLRKLFERQNYIVQPVYAIEGNVHRSLLGPFAATKITNEPLQQHYRKTRNQYSSYCSVSSSSESEIQCRRVRQQKVKMFRRTLKDEIMREHQKYQQKHQIHSQQMQYPSKENQYQVYSTPIQSKMREQTYADSSMNNIPSSASSFWEYLYVKTAACDRKYQTQRVEMPASCICPTLDKSLRCGGSACTVKQTEAGQQAGSCANLSGDGNKPVCECKGNQQNFPQKHSCDPMCTSSGQNKNCDPKCCSNTMEKSSTIDPLQNKSNDLRKRSKSKCVKCKCPKRSSKQQATKCGKSKDQNKTMQDPRKSQQSNGSQGTSVRPCQEGHDEIISTLKKKYNGEILCIHNPPCILINGCLNLPSQKEEPQNNDMSFWPVTQSIKHKFQNNQSCQYHVEVDQATDYRAEKKIQSICHHNPPCEVVRGCYKPKYDPQLQNSCVHVPMCKQMPECVVLDRSRVSCDHRPRCRDIPICSRNFVILTAKENIGTQVKTSVVSPAKNVVQYVCRHEPPCIMIPKCIGRMICENSHLDLDAIPGCIHQPPCELVPACCRKTAKQMVSVSSQYPNSCRIC